MTRRRLVPVRENGSVDFIVVHNLIDFAIDVCTLVKLLTKMWARHGIYQAISWGCIHSRALLSMVSTHDHRENLGSVTVIDQTKHRHHSTHVCDL